LGLPKIETNPERTIYSTSIDLDFSIPLEAD